MRRLTHTTQLSASQDKRSLEHESAAMQVSGSALYIDDLPEPANIKYAALGVSQHTFGKLEQVDLEEVRNSAGVVDVVTVADVPGHIDIAPVFDGDPILAHEQILFHGQPVFAVLADSTREARQAALKGKIQVAEQAPCLTIAQAHEANSFVRPMHTMQQGDADATLKHCEHRIQGSLDIGGQEHIYLEGQIAMAIPGEDDNIIVYSSTQHPTELQKLIAEVLDIKFHKVVVEMRRAGGAFGGKETQSAQWACIAALLASRNKCAVKLRLPRSQDMIVTGKRHPFSNQYEVGVDVNGQIQATKVKISGNCGHSPDLSDAIVDRAMFHTDNGYYLGDCKIEGHRCRTNQVSHTAFRGFGGPQGMMIGEAMMDKIARTLGKDPLLIRKQNLYSEENGRNTTQYGMQVENFLLPEIIEQLESKAEYWRRREEITAFNAKNRFIKKGLSLTPVKFGISFTVKHLNQAGALVHIYTDGSMQVNHGGTEMGQGLHTKIQQIAAQEMGIPAAMIEVTATRTDKVPNTSPTAASSGTDLNGKAVQNACITIKQRLADYFAQRFEVLADSVEFKDGTICSGEHQVDFAEFIQQAYMDRVHLSAAGHYKTPKIFYDRSTGKGRPFFYFAYGAALSEVTVDTLTGEYKVNRVDILHDTGKSINPALDIGQIEGAFIQGMGWLTSEELVWDETGKLASNNPATYKIPAIGDTPEVFNVELLDRDNSEDTIFRSKAVGEPPFMLAISVWCAIKDAISSLTQYKVDPPLHAPATPESVLAAIDAVQEN